MKRMYDGGKIVAGLIIGIGLFLFPLFYNGLKAAKPPDPELTPKAKEAKVCVEDKAYMQTKHMRILDDWRHDAVRRGDRLYKSSNGNIYEKSLQNTCMECHSNKSKFCDQCHNYMGVVPYCWECHIEPIEPKEKT
jgi:hypothetical protein